jgi:hypothetical protein
VPLLPDFPLATHWVKALVPQIKMNRPVVRELVAFLKSRLEDQHPASERSFESLAVD